MLGKLGQNYLSIDNNFDHEDLLTNKAQTAKGKKGKL